MINHALVLGGAMGVGKDTLLDPVKRAVESWNCREVSPQHMMGRFNVRPDHGRGNGEAVGCALATLHR